MKNSTEDEFEKKQKTIKVGIWRLGWAGAFRLDPVKTIIRPVYLPISGIQSEWHTVCVSRSGLMFRGYGSKLFAKVNYQQMTLVAKN